MIRIILSATILASAIPSFANVQTCKTSLATKEETVVKKPAVDVSGLDELIAELIGKKEATTVRPDIIVEAQKTKPFDKDPRAMNLNELLHKLGLQPDYTRLASAEFVRQTQNDHHLQLREEIQALFEAITTDDLTERQKLHLASYKKVIDQIISNSKVVRRHKIILGYDESPPPQSVEDLFISQPTATAAPVKKPSFFAKLFGRGSKEKEVGKAVGIPYENPVQYARALLERPSTERIEIIRQQVDKIGLLSHLEIYRILMTIPSQQQAQVYQMLKPNLIGRIDFYPFEALKVAADVDSVAALDIIPVNPGVILADLSETGTHLDILEVYKFLKTLDFKTAGIASAMVGRLLSIEKLLEITENHGKTIPFEDVLMFARVFVRSNLDEKIIEEGRAYLKSVFMEGTQQDKIEKLFNTELAKKNAPIEDSPETKDTQEHLAEKYDKGIEDTQLALVGQFSSVDWSFNANQDYLDKAISGLRMLRPISDKVQEQRVQALSQAVHSDFPGVRNAAGNAFIEMAQNEQDPFTQELILSEVIVNWDYGGDRGYLFKMIKAVSLMRPTNEDIEQMRIRYLGKAKLSTTVRVRNSATDVLCSIAICGHLTEGDQRAIVDEFAKVNWDYEPYIDNFFKVIASLKSIRPVSDSIQVERIKVLAEALISNYSSIRNSAADAIIQIASTETDALTQKTILNHCIVNWNFDQNQDYLYKMIKAVAAMKAANHVIEQQKINYLGNALKSKYSGIKNAASNVLCSISNCVNSY